MFEESHPKLDKKYICKVEEYHKYGCPSKIVRADSLDHADQIAGRCLHGNNYFAHRPT